MTGAPPGYVHTPRYMLRRRLVLHTMRRAPPGVCLDIGCGRGELLAHLVRRGHAVTGLEVSPEARAIAEVATTDLGHQTLLVADYAAIASRQFDYVFALEVLEHIEDDAAALKQWAQFVKPHGRLIMSVPAHMKQWTGADDRGGHCRRYERAQLKNLLQSSGLVVETLWSYGFPWSVLGVPLRRVLYRNASRDTAGSGTALSSLDSIRRTPFGAVVPSVALEGLGWLLHVCQLLFLRFDLGDGYLAVCRASDRGSS